MVCGQRVVRVAKDAVRGNVAQLLRKLSQRVCGLQPYDHKVECVDKLEWFLGLLHAVTSINLFLFWQNPESNWPAAKMLADWLSLLRPNFYCKAVLS